MAAPMPRAAPVTIATLMQETVCDGETAGTGSDKIEDREPVHPRLSDALGRHGRQGHINNAAYLDYLQEARVAFLLSGSQVLHQLLDSGVLVVSHQLEYLKPVAFSERPLMIKLWVDAIGGSRFSIGYEVFDGDDLAARARTAVVPF